MDYPYLKPTLEIDRPFHVTIVERRPSAQGDFGPQFPYVVSKEGEYFLHFATQTEEKSLIKIAVGETVGGKMVLNQYGKKSIYWDKPRGRKDQIDAPGAIAPVNPQVNEYHKKQKEKEDDRARSQVAMGLGMVWKTFMDQDLGETDVSRKAHKALSLALAFRPSFEDAVNKLFSANHNTESNSTPF